MVSNNRFLGQEKVMGFMFRKRVVFLLTISFLLLFFVGCSPEEVVVTTMPTLPPPTIIATLTPSATPTTNVEPTLTPTDFPAITLNSGDLYFSISGVPSFIFSRNLAGRMPEQYERLLAYAEAGGSQLVRIQLHSMGMGFNSTGEVEEEWVKKWERVFDQAAAHGISIIPVFGVWADWNGENQSFSKWDSNPLNEVNGGPAKSPMEIFEIESATQELWFKWMMVLVDRWQGRENIAAWEVFSEINIIEGAYEEIGIAFVEKAASIIRQSDSHNRPITASLAGLKNWKGWWPNLYHSSAIDFTSIHPYPDSGNLNSTVLDEVGWMLTEYSKPVLLGESGLHYASPDSEAGQLTLAENAPIGIRHAIWAGMVSGAMNARALWWEDGYAIYNPSLSWPFLERYAEIENAAANFVKGIDISNFQSLHSEFGGEIIGATIGNDQMVIGWYRDSSCEPPDWPLQAKISNQIITIYVPGTANDWQVDFFDTQTGNDILGSSLITREGNTILVSLPDFADDIAFKIYPQE